MTLFCLLDDDNIRYVGWNLLLNNKGNYKTQKKLRMMIVLKVKRVVMCDDNCYILVGPYVNYKIHCC